MAEVPVTIDGLLYDKLNKTTQNVVLIGSATLTGLGVGGGPIIPPPTKPPEGQPPTIWPNPPEGQAPIPSHPIALPGDPWWPKPPICPPDMTMPPPGSPPVVLPGTSPVHPITPPPAIVVDYPGVGKVLVPLPATPAPTPT